MDDHSTKSDLKSMGQELQKAIAENNRKIDVLGQQLGSKLDQMNDQLQNIEDKISKLDSKIH